MIDDPVDQHTSEVLGSREEAESAMREFQQKGWEVFHERVPLSGQFGFYCVRTVVRSDGSESRLAHSVRWNRFHEPLIPVTIACHTRQTFLSFLLRHGQHESFEYFEYGDGDVGLVCYCNALRGWSDVLQISDDFDHDLDETCQEILGEMANSGFDIED